MLDRELPSSHHPGPSAEVQQGSPSGPTCHVSAFGWPKCGFTPPLPITRTQSTPLANRDDKQTKQTLGQSNQATKWSLHSCLLLCWQRFMAALLYIRFSSQPVHMRKDCPPDKRQRWKPVSLLPNTPKAEPDAWSCCRRLHISSVAGRDACRSFTRLTKHPDIRLSCRKLESATDLCLHSNKYLHLDALHPSISRRRSLLRHDRRLVFLVSFRHAADGERTSPQLSCVLTLHPQVG